MDKQFANNHFRSFQVEDDQKGFTALRLERTRYGVATIAAEIVFWDAAGQFYLQTFDQDVELTIIEELILEAKHQISVK